MLGLTLGSCGPVLADEQVVADTTNDGVITNGPPAVEVHAWKQAREYFNSTFDAVRTDTGKILDVQRGDDFEFAQQFGLQGLFRMDQGRVLYTEVWIQPWAPNNDPQELYLHDLYVDLPTKGDCLWRIGKAFDCAFGMAPYYGNRKFTNYSPLQEAFTETPVLGIQYLPNNCSDGLSAGLLQSPRMGERFIGEAAATQFADDGLFRTTVPHLSELDRNSLGGPFQVSARYGETTMKGLNIGTSIERGAVG